MNHRNAEQALGVWVARDVWWARGFHGLRWVNRDEGGERRLVGRIWLIRQAQGRRVAKLGMNGWVKLRKGGRSETDAYVRSEKPGELVAAPLPES